MAGHRNFSELRAKMAPERRVKNDEAVKQMMADMLLSEIRKVAGLTQMDAAKTKKMQQLQAQEDMHLSTLQRLVEALGGTLEIVVNLPSGRVSVSSSLHPTAQASILL